MVRILRDHWIPIACVLFLLVNGVLLANEVPWLVLLPVVALVAWALMAAADRLLLFIVFATPLSINLEQLDLGGIGISLPTEPLMVALMLLFLLKLGLEKQVIDARVWRHPVTVVIGLQSAHIIMHSWQNWDWLFGDIDAGEDFGGFGNSRQAFMQNGGVEVVEVEEDMIFMFADAAAFADFHGH